MSFSASESFPYVYHQLSTFARTQPHSLIVTSVHIHFCNNWKLNLEADERLMNISHLSQWLHSHIHFSCVYLCIYDNDKDIHWMPRHRQIAVSLHHVLEPLAASELDDWEAAPRKEQKQNFFFVFLSAAACLLCEKMWAEWWDHTGKKKCNAIRKLINLKIIIAVQRFSAPLDATPY